MKLPLAILSILLVSIAAYFVWSFKTGSKLTNPTSPITQKAKPLDKYTFANLEKTKFAPSQITIGKVLKDDPAFTSYMFYFYVENRKVSGLLNLPKKAGTYPVIIMFHGFVDTKTYFTGEGTQHAGEAFAANGFITLAPDFFGYGESDKSVDDSFEDRFQTYTTNLTLINSVPNLNSALTTINSQALSDPTKIGIWGHSNGGQIALSVLEISSANFPTVLWAPVSKPFPYSILYYTDEYDDGGKALRKALAEFEDDYNIEAYSLTNFFDRINAPISIHQGTADEEVPQKWSDDLVATLKKLGKNVIYQTYVGEDHNFDISNYWSGIVQANIAFYKQYLVSAK